MQPEGRTQACSRGSKDAKIKTAGRLSNYTYFCMYYRESKSVSMHAMKVYEELEVQLHSSLIQIQVNGKVHDSATAPLAPILQEADCVPKPVWKFWKTESSTGGAFYQTAISHRESSAAAKVSRQIRKKREYAMGMKVLKSVISILISYRSLVSR